MKAKAFVLLLGVLCFAQVVKSQQLEGNIWYFGHYAGLTFNVLQADNNPTPLMDGQLTTNEGCATICDYLGNLLFYTDGIKVWGANHVEFPNAMAASPGGNLKGNPSSTQSGVIVPHPVNPNIYYIFAVDDDAGPDGFTYSRVDMSANGGLGDVVLAEKNVMLFTPSAEKITAVKHANGNDIWVIGHEMGTNNFRSYLVTAAGVQSGTPVITPCGSTTSGTGSPSRGYLKASANGEKLAMAVEGMDLYELYDFNSSTGVVSNPVSLSYANLEDCYGIEFSPDGHYLYGSERWGTEISQWDISLPTAAAIQASRVTVGVLNSAYGGAIQLAPDGRMYIARNYKKYLSIIQYPNDAGMGCGFVEQGVVLGPDLATAKASGEGLPTFIATFFVQAEFTVTETCENDTTFFNLGTNTLIDSAAWDLNYPYGLPQYQFTQYPPVTQPLAFVYDQAGMYTARLVTYRGNSSDTAFITFHASNYPVVDLGPDQTLCTNDTLYYDLSFNDVNSINGECLYHWVSQIGTNTYTSNLPTHAITKPGIYSVTVTADSICGSKSDQVIIAYNNVTANVGEDITSGLCQGTPHNLNATYTNSTYGTTSYLWSTGATTPVLSPTQSGDYSVTLTLGFCQDVDTVSLHFDTPLVASLPATASVCAGSQVTLNAGNPGATYHWSTGALTQNIVATIPGVYTVVITNGCGQITNNVNVSLLTTPVFDLGPNFSICHGVPEGLGSLVPGATAYHWNTGSSNPVILINSAGNYAVTVTNQCGNTVDQVTVSEVFPLTNFDLGPDTTVCPGYVLNAFTPGAFYFWSTGQTSPSITVTTPDLYEVEIDNLCGTYSSTIQIGIIPTTLNLGPDTLLCPGNSISLNAGNLGGTCLWSNGAFTPGIVVNQAGSFWVHATNQCGTFADTVLVQIFEPTLNLGNDTSLCEGASLVLDAGHPGSNYVWSTGENSQHITAFGGMAYSVTGQHACGFFLDTISIGLLPLPVEPFAVDTIYISDGEVIVLDALNAGAIFSWNGGQTSQTLNVSSPSTYEVTILNANGCQLTDKVVVLLHSGYDQPGFSRECLVFPNPSSGLVSIVGTKSQIQSLSLYNTLGQKILQKEGPAHLFQIERGSLVPGPYFLRVVLDNGLIFSEKLEFVY